MTVSIPFGSVPLNDTLRAVYVALGVYDRDAREIARVFPQTSEAGAIAGLTTAARLINDATLVVDWGQLVDPWHTVCVRLADPDAPAGTELLYAVEAFPPELQTAICGAVAVVATRLANETDDAGVALADDTPPDEPATTVNYVELIVPALATAIQDDLSNKAYNEARRRAEAGRRLLIWLGHSTNGRFIRTPQNAKYYLWRGQSRLFRLGSSAWQAFLYRVSGSNPVSSDFKYLDADCVTAAEECVPSDVARLAHWDNDTQVLRVNRFDGQVYCLDGHTITREQNGIGPALFEEVLHWVPYDPDFVDADALDWSTIELPNWNGNCKIAGLLLRTWWLTTFFNELVNSRPILVLKGEKGSGKSSTVRSLLQLTFGPNVDVVNVPDKEDALVAMLSNNHIVAIDNLDKPKPWMRDRLASVATGTTDQVRELYTTNDVHQIHYRCWVAVTSRTPDTLQRDDLADRSILLPLDRIAEWGSESSLRSLLRAKRSQWWGDVLGVLNRVVDEIRTNGIPSQAGLRMADWAALGLTIAQATGDVARWERALGLVRTEQTALLLDEDIVVEAIETWLHSLGYSDQWLTARDLCDAVGAALFKLTKPDRNWPQSARSFGRHLAGIQRELAARLVQDAITMERRTYCGNAQYRFIKAP